MGEYAKRISDDQEVKIGTCKSMYYLRYEDRHLVSPLENSIDASIEKNLFWRLPFPDEDNIRIGDYKEYKRGYYLYKNVEGAPYIDGKPSEHSEPFNDPETVDNPGLIQATHPCGYLINLKCYHGIKLPESNDAVQVHWNGKDPYVLELAHIKNMEDGRVLPIVRCKYCGHMWRYEWKDIVDYLHDEMKERLSIYFDKAVSL